MNGLRVMIKDFIRPHMIESDKILMLGCGNSSNNIEFETNYNFSLNLIFRIQRRNVSRWFQGHFER